MFASVQLMSNNCQASVLISLLWVIKMVRKIRGVASLFGLSWRRQEKKSYVRLAGKKMSGSCEAYFVAYDSDFSLS